MSDVLLGVEIGDRIPKVRSTKQCAEIERAMTTLVFLMFFHFPRVNITVRACDDWFSRIISGLNWHTIGTLSTDGVLIRILTVDRHIFKSIHPTERSGLSVTA